MFLGLVVSIISSGKTSGKHLCRQWTWRSPSTLSAVINLSESDIRQRSKPLRESRHQTPCWSFWASDQRRLREVQEIVSGNYKQGWNYRMLDKPTLSADTWKRHIELTRSRLPLKPSSARKGPLTNSLYLACTASKASTYAFGSWPLAI